MMMCGQRINIPGKYVNVPFSGKAIIRFINYNCTQ
ncbi:hypothetical protein UWK_00493 [Desulfocapsa sulfexigens DSM 10523]|uniref:Uncharacterized protein n=1 Tax=Desulfocapsa sulfexigens (strain DSM 10523 / SB164P1) TaxID=1167006 RepID=M1PKS3_DESSD|nr:hypothetical protein UWK_00493 [Desulfocapsa sulfexigens DSM 10523]